MTPFDRLKSLCDKQGISINDLEEKLDIGKNSLYSWKKGIPKGTNLIKVADYFNVSTDYLLGRETEKPYYALNKKDEKDISKRLESIIDDLQNTDALAFSKEDAELDEETNELLIDALHHALRIAKIKAKKKYTPKKYRNE
ncbi:helix-turn-helix transcriptional regulator [Enterococcus cecorum]|nr:helix-turn-helix transcriptional regulator [Enterococcus cecorum]